MKKRFISKKKLYLLGIVLICLLRFSLGMQLPRFINGNTPDDDVLYINLANNVLNGNWFGTYSSAVLNKSPGYTFFLLLPVVTGLPYNFWYEILVGCSVLLSVKAFVPILNTWAKKYIWIILLLFNPIFFDTGTALRLYRNALVPICVLFVISTLVGLYFSALGSEKNSLTWALGAGVSISFFWILREDSIWLLPFILGAIICTVYANWSAIIRQHNFKLAFTLFLPLLILIGTLNLVKTINYIQYGVYAITDFNDTAFAKVMTDIIRIQPKKEKPYIWVTHDTISKLYEVSPAFGELEPYIEQIYKGGWQLWGKLGDDGEIEKDYITWAMRDALSASGKYKDSQTLNDYLIRVHHEISSAFQDGRLQKRKGISISALSKPLSLEDADRWFGCVLEEIVFTTSYKPCNATPVMSTPPYQNIRLAESITKMVLPSSYYQVIIEGWGIPKNTNDSFKLFVGNMDNETPLTELVFKESQDVFAYFQEQGIVNPSALNARFSYTGIYDKNRPLFLYCFINGNLAQKLRIDRMLKDGFKSEQFQISIDSCEILQGADIMYFETYSSTIFSTILYVYQKTGFIFTITGVFCYVFSLMAYLRKFQDSHTVGILLIGLGICVSFLALHLGVAFNYYEAWNRDTRYTYLGATYILQMLFGLMSIFNWHKIYDNFKTVRKEHK